MKLRNKFARSALTLALSLVPPAATAQAPAATAQPAAESDAARSARAALEGRALALLEEVGTEAQSLRLAENRARVQIAAAELLWPRDEKRARELFDATLASVAAGAGAVAPEDPRYQQLALEAHALRREIIQIVAQRDPKLALDFLRATRVPAPPAGQRNRHQPDQELALETSLAEMVAARDPKQALRLAEESLARGVAGNVASVYERVRAAEPEGAARLANSIAGRIRGAGLATNYEALNVAAHLLRVTRPPEPAPAAPAGGAPVIVPLAPRAQMDEAARRDMVVALAAAALAAWNDPQQRGQAQHILGMLREFTPELERYAPTQAAALRRVMPETQVRRAQQQNTAAAELDRQLRAAPSAEAMAELASKAPPESRGNVYRAAAYRALNEGAFERARQIVSAAAFENAGEREQLLREIEQQVFWRAASRGDVEQALAALPRTRTPEERAGLLLQLARSAHAAGHREAAARVLEDAWGPLAGRARDQNQFNLQLQAAQVYALLGHERAFEIAEASAGQLNELLDAAAVVDGFGHNSFEQDELRPHGAYQWLSMLQQTGEVLAALARTDFDRALSVADRLRRAEARIRLRLAVARGPLTPGPAAQTLPPRRTRGISF